MFGSSQGSGLFGSKPAGGSIFGSSNTTTTTGSTFGQSNTSGGLFGKPAGGSLFGSTTQNKPAFGSSFGSSTQNTSSGGLFGGSTTASSTFGTSTTGGGLFGSSQQSGTSGGMFGKPTTSSGLFGSSSTFGASNVPNGTTIKFVPPINNDTMMKNSVSQSIQTKNFCITAMKEYEAKSFEELRVDDYIANRKAPAAGSTGGGLFGSNTSNTNASGGLFGGGGGGTQQKSLFGSSTTSSPFGGGTNQGTSLFGSGAQQQQSGGLFGSKPATGGGLFGGSTAPATHGFGSSTTAGNTLFGKPATSSPFGGTQQNATGTFGSPQSAQQQNAGSTLFGGGTATTNTSFGGTPNTGGGLFGSAPANTSGGLFGKPAISTGFGGFGTTSQPATATSGGLFGSTTAAKPGGLFGNTTTTNTGGGLFGSPGTQQAGGLFASSQPTQQSGGLFGSNVQPAGNVVVSNPATVAVATQPIVLGSDVNETTLKMAMIEANLATNPYGDSPLLKLSSSVDTDEKPNPISAQRQMRFLKKASETGVTTPITGAGSPIVGKSAFLSMNVPVAGSKIRSRSIAVSGDLNYKSTRTPPTLGKGIGGKVPGGNTSANISLNGSFANKSVDTHIERALSNNSNTLPGSAKKGNIKYLDLDEVKSVMKSTPKSALRPSRDADELPITETIDDTENNMNSSVSADPREAAIRRTEIQRQPPVRLDLNVTSETNTSIVSSVSAASPQEEEILAPAGITLKTNDYYCEPTIREMANMVQNNEVVLPDGLTIGRATYGNVYWPGPLRLKDIALDEVVVFRHKEVTVYPDESKKPPLGEGLNRAAEVTLERVWFVNRETKEEVKDPILLADIGWRNRLERVTLKMGAIFKDYRPSTGSWVFKVEHFSKYGLPDDDDDDVISKKPVDPKKKELELQSRVQRTAVHSEILPENDEMPLEIEMEDIIYVSGARTVPSSMPILRGLGGDLDASCDMEIGYDNDADELVLPPEKKLKMDMDQQALFEKSKKLLTEAAERLMMMNQHGSRLQEETRLYCISPARQFEGGVPADKAYGFGVSKFLDLCSARGTVSRVGWSGSGVFAKSLQPENNCILVRPIERAGEIQQDYVTDMLEHNIRLSQVIQRNHSISAKVRHHELEGQQVAPRIKPTNDHAQLIDSFCATASQSNRSDEERVWKLSKALFPGNHDGRWRWERLDNVCDWLKEEISSQPKLKISGRGATVWQALCRGNLEETIKAADEEGLLHLCTMLATFQVDPRATQQDFHEQLVFWEDFQMLEHIDIHILKTYLLMGGKLSITFKTKSGKKTVSCIDGLPWKQAIGIYLWYLRGFRCFEETLDEAVECLPSPQNADDVLFYHLLRLSRDQAYSIETVLDAAVEFSSNVFDGHLSWHLWTVIRSLGYNTMNPAAEQRLHISYAEQLMANRLPHLALFVLSHISNDQVRSERMKECIDRFAMTSTKTDYNRMLEVVTIPSSWIASSRYIKAKLNGQTSLACKMALEAGDYLRAYDLYTREVAPNAVVSDRLSELEQLANLFEVVSDRIPAWGLNGELYTDYVEFKNLCKEENDDEIRLGELVSALTAKVQSATFETPIQRLCAQTISLEMFEAQRLINGKLNFSMPFDMANLTQELTRSINAAPAINATTLSNLSSRIVSQ